MLHKGTPRAKHDSTYFYSTFLTGLPCSQSRKHILGKQMIYSCPMYCKASAWADPAKAALNTSNSCASPIVERLPVAGKNGQQVLGHGMHPCALKKTCCLSSLSALMHSFHVPSSYFCYRQRKIQAKVLQLDQTDWGASTGSPKPFGFQGIHTKSTHSLSLSLK